MGSYSIEDVQELQSQPIFLSQFLRLSLPPIRTLASDSNDGRPRQPVTNHRAYFGSSPSVATGDSPPSQTLLDALLSPSSIKVIQWPSFLYAIQESLTTIQGVEHILAPPAFRSDDLPIATLLPTVFLWVIVGVWQPCLRMWSLDEFHIAIGAGSGGTGSGSSGEEKRRELKAGDHLPEHEDLPWAKHSDDSVGALPRQVFYTILPTTTRDRLVPPGDDEDKDFRGIKALISVEEPWRIDMSLLDLTSVASGDVLSQLKLAGEAASQGQKKNTSDNGDCKDAAKAAATYAAVLTSLSSLQESKVRFAVLTTYEVFLFIKVDFSSQGLIQTVQISPPVRASDALKEGRSSTVFAAMWWFGQQVMTT